MRYPIVTVLILSLVIFSGCDQQGPLESDTKILLNEAPGHADASNQQILASGPVVEIPAGSVNALADAIAEAGEGGVVLLKSGQHHESGTVEINYKVSIVGETGATLISDTHPATTTGIMKPALFIHNAPGVVIHGLHILPKGEIGGTAIFVENASGVHIYENKIEEHEFGVIVQKGDRASINKNTIVGSSGWLTGEIGVAEGILLVNGSFAEIKGNRISNTLLGIFASDRKGLLQGNELFGNFIGIVLCNVPLEIPTPGGEIVGSETNATKWIVRENRSHDNFDIGYLVIDGANNNLLVNNQAGNNGRYDIELAGETERFGFLAPTSRDSKVVLGKYSGLTVKDCGVNDQITGDAVLVDTVADPCN